VLRPADLHLITEGQFVEAVSLLEQAGLVHTSVVPTSLNVQRLAAGNEPAFVRFCEQIELRVGRTTTLGLVGSCNLHGYEPDELDTLLLRWRAQGWLSYADSKRERVVSVQLGAAVITRQLLDLLDERRANLEQQRDHMIAYAEQQGQCRHQLIARHFDEPDLKPGGNACDVRQVQAATQAELEHQRQVQLAAAEEQRRVEAERQEQQRQKAVARERQQQAELAAYYRSTAQAACPQVEVVRFKAEQAEVLVKLQQGERVEVLPNSLQVKDGYVLQGVYVIVFGVGKRGWVRADQLHYPAGRTATTAASSCQVRHDYAVDKGLAEVLPPGSRVELLPEPPVYHPPFVWRKVRTQAGNVGWAINSVLKVEP